MPELDPTQQAFDKLRQDVLPLIRRPGVDAARKSVRRRHSRNTAAGIFAVLAVTVASLVLPPQLLGLRPATEVSPSPTLPVTPIPSPVTPIPSSDDPVTPTQSGIPSSMPVGQSCIGDPIGVGWRTVGQDTDMRYAEHGTGSTDRPICPGVRLKIIWASYTLDERMNARLFRSGFVYIDRDHPRQIVHAQLPRGCNTWYVTRSDVRVPEFIDARWRRVNGAGGPFWDARYEIESIAYSSQTWSCLTPTPVPTATR